MSRSDKVYLQDIVESIKIIDTYIGNKTDFEFSRDLMVQDAVIKKI